MPYYWMQCSLQRLHRASAIIHTS